MKKKEHAALAAVAGLALVVGACASTRMTSTWKDPEAGKTRLSRIAVISMAEDEAVRQVAENEVANRVGPRVTASYKVLAGINVNDRQAVQDRLGQQGFDGLLVIRLAGTSEHVVDELPSASFYTHYDWVYPADHGRAVEPVFHVVSTLYTLPDQKVIWSGSSQTSAPRSVRELLDGVSKAVAKALRKSRLIV